MEAAGGLDFDAFLDLLRDRATARRDALTSGAVDAQPQVEVTSAAELAALLETNGLTTVAVVALGSESLRFCEAADLDLAQDGLMAAADASWVLNRSGSQPVLLIL